METANGDIMSSFPLLKKGFVLTPSLKSISLKNDIMQYIVMETRLLKESKAP